MTSTNIVPTNDNRFEKMVSFLKSRTFSFGLGYVSFLGGRLLRDLLLARILGAHSFGSWAALNILRQYGNYSDLGLMNGLSRELPRARKDENEASELAGHAVIGTFVGTLAAVVWVLFVQPGGFSTASIGWTTLTLMLTFICFEKIYKFYNAVLLGLDRVRHAGLWLTCLSLLDLLLAITGAYFYGIEGLMMGTVVAMTVTALAMALNQPLKVKFNFSLAKFKILLFSSLLLMCFGLLNVALHNFDRTLYLFLSGGPDPILGSYHVASLYALSVSVIPFVLCSVVNPRLYALKEDDNSEFLETISRVGLWSTVIASVVAASTFLFGPIILKLIFPNQEHSVAISPFLILGELFFAASMIMDTVLIVKNKGIRILISKALVMLFVMGAAIVYFKFFNQLTSVHLARGLSVFMMLAQVGSFLVTYLFCLHSLDNGFKLKTFFKTGTTVLFLAATVVLFFASMKIFVLWKI